MQKLFEPITIRNMTLKNRIVMPAMGLNIGLRNKRAIAFYAERARGGVGTIISTALIADMFLSDESWQHSGEAARFLQGLRSLTEELHQADVKFGVQLWHGNRFPPRLGIGNMLGDPVAPSAREGMRELTIKEIKSTINNFALATLKAKESGIDFVEFHGAHGYLPHQFFSPLSNRREDKYGGDLESRMRFATECIAATRRVVGNDYPLFWRLSAEEAAPGGITLADSCELAIKLEEAGIDVIDVSFGPGPNGGPIDSLPTKKQPMGTFIPLAETIKQKVSVPVIGVGRINSYKVAEAILSRRRVDLIAIGRQLIADPFWPKKVKEERAKEIIACKSCNYCFSELGRLPKGSSICQQNDRAGREWELLAPE